MEALNKKYMDDELMKNKEILYSVIMIKYKMNLYIKKSLKIINLFFLLL